MIILRPLPQETINLINEYDTRLTLPRQTKQPRNEFIALPVPLIGKHARSDIDEGSS